MVSFYLSITLNFILFSLLSAYFSETMILDNRNFFLGLTANDFSIPSYSFVFLSITPIIHFFFYVKKAKAFMSHIENQLQLKPFKEQKIIISNLNNESDTSSLLKTFKSIFLFKLNKKHIAKVTLEKIEHKNHNQL